ncbi:FAD-dependent oxidoreductase [Geodermatophilus amargosae]|uniref:FAD-dependent oxidoreductase n=1 Tax=Geodermatophilus amargosae TaxID=1296565 RepID=UPI000B8587DB|nr:FAD-dependent monooxygenase [Geodermatophilus amargosae]
MEAIVVGGGLAGLTTALALHLVGVEVTVHEAAGPAEGQGAWLTLAANGLDALVPLGLAREVEAAGFPTPRMAVRAADGRELVAFDSSAPRPDGLGATSIRRADLYAVLRSALARDGIPVHHGRRLGDAGSLAGGRVRACFADGATADGDLLVGADGLRSRTRTLVDPAAPSARYTGLLNVGGYARGLDLGRPPGVMDFWFGRRCFLGTVADPDGDVWWFANPPGAQEPSRADVAADDAEAWRPRLRELFAGDRLPVGDLLDASDALFAGWPTYDLPRVPTWHCDGMVLVGDAVHAASPASGQGASMAFEDAVALARCLRDVPGVDDACAVYERLRRRRVEAVVRRGKRTGDAKAPGPVGRWVRDRVAMPLFARHLARRTTPLDAWLTGSHVDWDTDVAV